MRLSRTNLGAVLLAGVVAALTVGCTESSSPESSSPESPVDSVGSTSPATKASTADSAGSTTPGTDSPTSSEAPAAAMPEPEGEPIVIAMISQESGPAALPDSRLAAEAAVAYVNAELGGAAGRPLQLETCVTDGSPEQSSSCANGLAIAERAYVLSHGSLVLTAPAAELRDNMSLLEASYLGEGNVGATPDRRSR
jgi:hypothetical protein